MTVDDTVRAWQADKRLVQPDERVELAVGLRRHPMPTRRVFARDFVSPLHRQCSTSKPELALNLSRIRLRSKRVRSYNRSHRIAGWHVLSLPIAPRLILDAVYKVHCGQPVTCFVQGRRDAQNIGPSIALCYFNSPHLRAHGTRSSRGLQRAATEPGTSQGVLLPTRN